VLREPPSAGQKTALPRRILVVDDNVDAATTLEVLLRSLGHETRVAHDGMRALDIAREFRPEVILLDIGMPGLDGYEVARRLRAMNHGQTFRIVASLLGRRPIAAARGGGLRSAPRQARGSGHARDRARAKRGNTPLRNSDSVPEFLPHRGAGAPLVARTALDDVLVAHADRMTPRSTKPEPVAKTSHSSAKIMAQHALQHIEYAPATRK